MLTSQMVTSQREKIHNSTNTEQDLPKNVSILYNINL